MPAHSSTARTGPPAITPATPLNAILGWASLLRNPEQTQVVSKGIEVIHRNA